MKAFATAVFLLLSFNPINPAFAVDVSFCVTAESDPYSGLALRNICNKKIWVTFCIKNPRSSFDCSKTAYGGTALAPNKKESILTYSDEGGGAIYYAVCAYPEAPIDWHGPGFRYHCQ